MRYANEKAAEGKCFFPSVSLFRFARIFIENPVGGVRRPAHGLVYIISRIQAVNPIHSGMLFCSIAQLCPLLGAGMKSLPAGGLRAFLDGQKSYPKGNVAIRTAISVSAIDRAG